MDLEVTIDALYGVEVYLMTGDAWNRLDNAEELLAGTVGDTMSLSLTKPYWLMVRAMDLDPIFGMHFRVK